MFGAPEAKHVKFGLQIERKQYTGITHANVLRVHSRSRDLLKFWEISANISETVQDIVTTED